MNNTELVNLEQQRAPVFSSLLDEIQAKEKATGDFMAHMLFVEALGLNPYAKDFDTQVADIRNRLGMINVKLTA